MQRKAESHTHHVSDIIGVVLQPSGTLEFSTDEFARTEEGKIFEGDCVRRRSWLVERTRAVSIIKKNHHAKTRELTCVLGRR